MVFGDFGVGFGVKAFGTVGSMSGFVRGVIFFVGSTVGLPDFGAGVSVAADVAVAVTAGVEIVVFETLFFVSVESELFSQKNPVMPPTESKPIAKIGNSKGILKPNFDLGFGSRNIRGADSGCSGLEILPAGFVAKIVAGKDCVTACLGKDDWVTKGTVCEDCVREDGASEISACSVPED